MTYDLEVQCKECGKKHSVPLDHSGHFTGKVGCGQRLKVQVDPQEWRKFVEKSSLETRH